MKKVFIVTGANGFLGNHIVRGLAEKEEVRALVLPEDKSAALENVKCKIYRGDVTQIETLEDIFQTGPEVELYVIHCAAMVYIKSKYNPDVYRVNVDGTRNVIQKVLEKNAKLVYVSSVHAITEKPKGEIMTEIRHFEPDKVEGLYAKTKAKAANYCLRMVQKRNLNACIVHPSGILGPGDFGSSHLTQLIIDFACGRLKACVKGGYDFVDVRDVADGVIAACERGKKGECYILSNRYIEVRELLDRISEVRHTKKIQSVLPMWLARGTAPLSELYYRLLRQPPLYTRYSLYTLTSNANFSNEKAKQELQFTNRSFRETIADTVKWLEAAGRI